MNTKLTKKFQFIQKKLKLILKEFLATPSLGGGRSKYILYNVFQVLYSANNKS